MSAVRVDARSGLACLLLAFTALGASSCNFSEDLRVAHETSRLHEHLKLSKFDEIYRKASPMLRRNKSEAEFVAQLSKLRSRLGDIEKVEMTDIGLKRVAEFQESKLITETYEVTGSGGKCAEVIFWVLEGNEIRLDGYECYFQNITR